MGGRAGVMEEEAKEAHAWGLNGGSGRQFGSEFNGCLVSRWKLGRRTRESKQQQRDFMGLIHSLPEDPFFQGVDFSLCLYVYRLF